MIVDPQTLGTLRDEYLADKLTEIASVLRATVAMPRAAEAVAEAARRIRERAK